MRNSDLRWPRWSIDIAGEPEENDYQWVRPHAPLLDHLLIPVGEELIISEPIGFDYEDHLPGSLDNLKNLPNSTTISLEFNFPLSRFQFIGPNGELLIILENGRVDISVNLDCVAWFGSSKVGYPRVAVSGYPDAGVVH